MFYEVISGQKRIYSVTQGEVNTFSGMVSKVIGQKLDGSLVSPFL